MTTLEIKISHFNGFITELIEWYKESNKSLENNDLSILKILKLLFLWAAEDKAALNIFDNFKALPLWPVEMVIYNAIKQKNLKLKFDINVHRTNPQAKLLDRKTSPIAMSMIQHLKSKNPALIKKTASQLVEITHNRDCWRIANFTGQLKLSTSDILNSNSSYL